MVKRTKEEETGRPSADKEEKGDEKSAKAQAAEIELSEKLKAKEKEAADNYDKYLRTAAELDNYRKRAARDKSEAIKYGNENLLKDLLPIVDSLDRAMEHATGASDIKAFTEGLRLIQSQLVCLLEKYGVTKVDCLSQAFDPTVHEAMLQVESSEHEDNQVVCEFEKGYVLNGRLLRPSKVSVCKRSDKKKQPEAEESGKKIEIKA
jgi:molecular chaperone GrpE